MTVETDNDDTAAPVLLEDMIAGITDDDAPAADGAADAKADDEQADALKGADGDGEAAADGDEAAGGAEEDAGAEEEAPASAEGEHEERKRLSGQGKRIAKLSADRDVARREAAEVRAELEAYKASKAGEDGAKLYTQSEVDALVSSEAEKRATAKVTDEKLDALFNAGVAKHGDFETRVAAYGSEFGPELAKRTDFFDALTELPNGADVIYTLGGDLDHMAEVLDMSPAKMGIELAKLSAKLAEAAKPKPKPISKAPAPIVPLNTQARGELSMDDDDMPMEEFGKRLFKGMAERAG